MSYEWFIAKRYIWSKRQHPFVGIISFISILGICVGVSALIIVLSVMNGFDEDLRNRIIGTRSHLTVEANDSFENWQEISQTLHQMPAVVGVAPFVEGQALLQRLEWASGVLVRGIDLAKEKQVSKLHTYLTQGTLSGQESQVVVGAELAKKFRLQLGSELSLISPVSEKPASFVVSGIFSSGMYEVDANILFLNLADAQALFGFERSVSGLSLSLQKAKDAPQIKENLQETLGSSYWVRTWMDMNKNLFGALKLEKMVMFLILALIILVACLNIAGSLTILVIDKTKDIGILKALGVPPGNLSKIFAFDGLFLGGGGALAGSVIGVGLSFLLKTSSFVELPKEIYYLDRLPIKIDWVDTGLVVLVAIVLSLACSLYPAVMAGRLDPVKALRYE